MPSGHFNRRFEDLRQVFQVRAFALFSIGNFATLMAIWIVRVCVAWLTWEQTHSKTWLGVMAFAELGPSVLISFWSGPLADRRDRVTIMRYGQSTQMVLAIALVGLTLSGRLTVWWMLAAMLGYSAMAGLTLPARMAVVPSLVPRAQIATASAVGSVALNLTRLAGPIIAAVLLATDLEAGAFMLSVIGFGLNVWCLARLKPEEQAVEARASSAPPAGFTYREVIISVMSDPRLSLVLALQFVANMLLRPLTDMFPAYADQVFGRGEHGFAALTAAVGAGAIAGAGLMIGGSDGPAMLRHVYVGTVALGLCTMTFAGIENFWLGLAFLAVYGGLLTTSGISGTSYVQINTPPEQLGRVMSIYGLIFRLAPALGALFLGLIADIMGVALATAGFAVAALVTLAAMWRKYRAATM